MCRWLVSGVPVLHCVVAESAVRSERIGNQVAVHKRDPESAVEEFSRSGAWPSRGARPGAGSGTCVFPRQLDVYELLPWILLACAMH